LNFFKELKDTHEKIGKIIKYVYYTWVILIKYAIMEN